MSKRDAVIRSIADLHAYADTVADRNPTRMTVARDVFAELLKHRDDQKYDMPPLFGAIPVVVSDAMPNGAMMFFGNDGKILGGLVL